MLVGTRFSTKECTEDAAANDGDQGIGWIGNLSKDPAEFGITSVWTTSVFFQRVSGVDSGKAQHLCTGSTLVFAPYTAVERTQEKITTHAIGLEHIATKMTM